MTDILNLKIGTLELRRELLHILTGIVAILLISHGILTPWIIFFILLLGILLSFLSLRTEVPLISWFLNNFEREKDRKELPGRALLFGLAGSLLVLKLFPMDIALASITILTFADPISHIIGKCFGRIKSIFDKNKNIEGHISGFIISSLFAMLLVPVWMALVGSFVAVVFESLIIEVQKIKLDDNLLIPLAAGTAMYLLRIWF